MEVKDGQLFVEPYEYYDRDAMFIADPDIADIRTVQEAVDYLEKISQ